MVVTAMADSSRASRASLGSGLDIVEATSWRSRSRSSIRSRRGDAPSRLPCLPCGSLCTMPASCRASISQLFDAAGSTLLAEGMRFSARIAAGRGTLPSMTSLPKMSCSIALALLSGS